MQRRIPDTPPIIAPYLQISGETRPRWSVMIPAYNCINYLGETLHSVLQQAESPEEMQIEVVDDCSVDDIQSLVKEIGKGRIGYFRQESNKGSLRNFQTCINRASGEWIHLLHGDDLVLPGFYRKMRELTNNFPDAGAAFCRHRTIDEKGDQLFLSPIEQTNNGILDNWLERLFTKQRIQTPSIIVKREVYETLGSFYGVCYGEDWEMWLRIASRFPFAYTPEILAAYRKHTNSISAIEIKTGQNIRDLKKVLQLTEHLLPASHKNGVLRKTQKFYAHYAVRTANQLWDKYQDAAGASAQLKEAFGLHIDPTILLAALKLKTKIAFKVK